MSEVESGAIQDDDFIEPNENQKIESKGVINSIEHKEEGQIDETIQNLLISDIIKKATMNQQKSSNLLRVLSQIEVFFNKFEVDKNMLGAAKKTSNITNNYPKYLQKFSLMKLQFKDHIFRETFIYQVMIFLDCLKNPIKDQVNIFKVDEQEVKYLHHLMNRAARLLKTNEDQVVSQYSNGKYTSSNLSGQKRTYTEMRFDQSRALMKILKREDKWAKAKNMINNKLQSEESTSLFDLTNFDIQVDPSITSRF